MLTPWNYEVTRSLPPIITAEDFDKITGGAMSATTEQKEAMLSSVSQAIRDHCGWHVAPNVKCTFTGEGEGRLLVLPTLAVNEVTSLEIAGVAADFEWRSCGLVRLKAGAFPDSWRSVKCCYSAGYDSTGSLGAIVAQIASNALAAAPGIAEEHAGGVGATYNKTGDGITGGVSLLARDKELLSPYVLSGAW